MIIIFSKFFKRLNLVGKLGMKCGGQQSLNKEIDIYRISRFIYKKKKFKICLLTFVSFVPLIIFIALSE